MPEIEAGAELDRLVAEALALDEGWSYYLCESCGRAKFDCYRVSDGAFCSCDRPHGGSMPRLIAAGFRPSTDVIAAFAAAQKVDLFWEWALTLVGDPDRWILMERGGDDWDMRIGEGETPALAICAAILKLKESVGA